MPRHARCPGGVVSAGTRWTHPDGGLFLWVRLPGLDTEDLLVDAVREKVAFVPGAPFFARAKDRSFLRLNFSNRPPEAIADGIARLGAAAARRVQPIRAAAQA